MRFVCNTILIILSVALVAGCVSTRNGAAPQSLDDSAWVLSSLPGHVFVPGAMPTAQFESGRVAGSDGCNRYSMPFTVKGSAIEIGPLGPSTMMACDENIMAQAAAFTAALQSARSFRTGNGTLELLNATGAIVATFVAQSHSLAGTSWNVTMINNGRQALVSIVDGSTVTMAFDMEGRVSGTTGCNRYSGGYTADGDTIRFSPVAATRMACADPAINEQEQNFLRLFDGALTMQFESDRLDLRRADGELAMILTRAHQP